MTSDSSIPSPKQRRNPRFNWTPYLLILPSLIYLALFFAWPMVRGLNLAVREDGAALELQAEPSRNSLSAGQLPRGTQVNIRDQPGNTIPSEELQQGNVTTETWFQIRSQDTSGQPIEGWVSEQRIRVRESDDNGVPIAGTVRAVISSTADPLTSDRGTMLVNASWGLGEAIVSGVVTPDTWSIRKDGMEIASRQIGHKTVQVRRTADGTTSEVSVPDELRDVPSLSDGELAELAVIALEVEEHYQAPMDVEWALAGGRFFILQARPITTLAESGGLAYPPGDYNRTMFLEIFPDPLSPAFTSVVEPLFGGMLDFSFRALGFRPPAD